MINLIQILLGLPIWYAASMYWGWKLTGVILLGQLGMILATRRQ